MSDSKPRRPLTAADLWSMKRVGAPKASPAGKQVVSPVTTYDTDKNKGRTRLWLLTEGEPEPRALTSDEASSDQPAWSPDGQRLAFTRRRDGEKPQLYVMSVAGGEAEKLTDFPLGIFDPQWFPDGQRIAFAANVLNGELPAGGAAAGLATAGASPGAAPTAAPAGGPGTTAASAGGPGTAAAGSAASATSTPPVAPADPESILRTRRLQTSRDADPVKARVSEDRVFRYWDRWLTDGQAPHLFVIDLASRRITDLTPDSTRWFDWMDPCGQYDISPDGGEIAFSANGSEAPYALLNWDVFAVTLTRQPDGRTIAGPVRNLTADNPADDMKPRYTPDGQAIVYGRSQDPLFYADTVRLVRYDRASGRHDVLTDHWDRSPTAWEVSRDGRRLYALAEENARTALFTLPLPAGGAVTRLVPGGSLTGLDEGPDGRLWFTYQDLSGPAEVAACGADGAGFKRQTALNAPALESLALGRVEERVFKGADDHDVQMWVIYPPGFDPQKKYPLVQVIHGGPHAISADAFHWRWNGQLFAAPGHIVAMVNFHGSTSWGQDFTASILGAHGDKPFTDIMRATDLLISEGSVDVKRLAASGGSYGGYMVTWIAGHTDRFACLVNHAGVYDLLSQYASDVSQGRAKAYGGEPWDGLENIDRWSPCRFAAGFKSPMLVLHGDNDYRVPATQGLEVYGVYKAKGLPARLASYPDENHWILSPRNALHWYGEVFGWLKRWLGA